MKQVVKWTAEGAVKWIYHSSRYPEYSATCGHTSFAPTRFPFGSGPSVLNLAAYNNSPDHSTKGTTSHLNVLCVLVNIWFQVLFHSAPAVLFTFPSRYFSSIGHRVVFRLGGWSPLFLSGFLVSADTQDTAACLPVSPT